MFDPDFDQNVTRFLRQYAAPKTNVIPLANPPDTSGSFVICEPLGQDDEPFGGTLSIPTRAVLMIGNSRSSELGFHYNDMEA